MSSSTVGIWNRALHRIGATARLESETDSRPEAAACELQWDDVVGSVFEDLKPPWARRQRTLAEISTQEETYTYGDSADNATFEIPYAFINTTDVTVTHIDSSGSETELSADDGEYTIALGADESLSATFVLTTALASGESVRVSVVTSRVGWEYVYGLPADYVSPIALLYGEARTWLIGPDAREPYEIVTNAADDGMLLFCDIAAEDIDAFEYIAKIDRVAIWPKTFGNAVVARLSYELAWSIKKDPALAAACWREYEKASAEAAGFQNGVNTNGPAPMTPSASSRW